MLPKWRNSVIENIRPGRSLLAVIDIENDFCSPGGAFARMGADVTECAIVAKRIAQATDILRPLLNRIAFFRLVYEPAAMTAVQRERLLEDGSPRICDPHGSGTNFYVVLPSPEDLVYTKHQYSIFSVNPFLEYLAVHAIENIILAGVDTHVCVESAARQGYDLGYRMVVLSDLVATRASAQASHDDALVTCEKYFGLVMTSEDLLKLWAGKVKLRVASP